MPAAFPVAFPTIPGVSWRPARFRMADTTAMATTRAGAVNHALMATPTWTLAMAADFSTVQGEETLDRFIQSMRVALGAVIVGQSDVFCRPLNHSAGTADAAAADQTGVVDSVTGFDVTVSGVDTDLSLAEFDLVGFEKDGAYGLGVLQAASAAGTTTRVLTLRPLPSGPAFAAGATVRFVDPKLKMRLVPGSYQPASEHFASASFSLVEIAV